MHPPRNNNVYAKERDNAGWNFLDVYPSTAAQLVKAGIYPTEEKARQRLKRGEARGLVSYVGHVTNPEGRKEILWARFEVENPQHEYEITALILSARPDAVRRGHQVGKFRPDAEMLFGNQLVYLERERTRKSLDRVRERINKYDCTNQVCWVVDTDTRIKNILGACNPPPNHYFTTYEQAIGNWHDRGIWQHNAQVAS